MLGMEQNLFPHFRSLEEGDVEEERRLCYVAITRAGRRLTLTYARERTLFGNFGRALPSQFLKELAGHVEFESQVSHGRATNGSTRSGEQSWSTPSSFTPSPTPRAPLDILPDISVGDEVRHDTLGEGIVIGLDSGGQVVVRFSSDGSERRLLLAYAPMQRV